MMTPEDHRLAWLMRRDDPVEQLRLINEGDKRMFRSLGIDVGRGAALLVAVCGVVTAARRLRA